MPLMTLLMFVYLNSYGENFYILNITFCKVHIENAVVYVHVHIMRILVTVDVY